MIDINYRQKKVIEEFLLDDNKLRQIVLTKNKTTRGDTYQLYYNVLLENGDVIPQGYMYFNVSADFNTSSYIGTYVNPKFRRCNIAEILNSFWISFCLDHGIENLKTIHHQRKPFLIYMLKKYGFEVSNVNKYLDGCIHICEKDDENFKCLFFDILKQKEIFMRSKIYECDDYKIVNSLDGYTDIEQVLLNHKYYLHDNYKAYQMASDVKKKCIKR